MLYHSTRATAFAVVSFSLFACYIGVASGQEAAESKPPKAETGVPAVRALLDDYQDAFAKRDYSRLMNHWSGTATYSDTTAGISAEGAPAIVELIRGAIDEDSKLQLEITTDRVRLLNPQTARFDGTTTLTGEDEQSNTFEFTGTAVLQDGVWRLDAIYELAQVPELSAAEQLAPLAWLEGSWKDDVQGVDVRSDFRWLGGNNFLVRVFTAETDGSPVQSGVQIIGWDPNAEQIRSWRFLADGTFGEGVWEQTSDSWLIKSTQVMRSGTNASGTFVVTPIDADKMTVKAVGRDVGGEPLPTGDEVTVRRLEEDGNGDLPNTKEQN